LDYSISFEKKYFKTAFFASKRDENISKSRQKNNGTNGLKNDDRV
jgi:hypothetical protein